MALIKPGSIVADIRGSVGDETYSRNQGGLFVRARAAPANPNTPAQQACRAVITALSQFWSGTLTDQQRSNWRQYAHQHPRANRFGDRTLTNGYTRFIRINFHRFRNDLVVPYVEPPPVPPLWPPETTITAKANPDQVTISVAFPRYDGGTKHLTIYAFGGNNVNPGVMFYNGPWRLIDLNKFVVNWWKDPWTIAYPLDLLAADKVFVRLVAQHWTEGQMSEPFQTSTIVTP